MWPGFGENCRVLDWIFQRLDGKEDIAQETPIGYVPSKNGLRTDGLKENIDFEQLFNIDRDFWKQEVYFRAKFLKSKRIKTSHKIHFSLNRNFSLLNNSFLCFGLS